LCGYDGSIMSELSELLERFRRGPELVATALTGAAGSELDFAPEQGKWTVRQIVAHLADSEIVVAGRFRTMIAEDNATLMAFDQAAWAERLDYRRRKTSEALDTFRRIRAENYDLLKELPETGFARTATHSERGKLSVQNLLELAAAHAESHARQIREVRDRYRQAKQRSAGGQA